MEEKMICLRDKIGEFLCEFAREDKRIYVIDSDLAKSTKTIEFQKEFPERFVETGIAEASAMSIATGLAAEGQIPFYVNFAIFVADKKEFKFAKLSDDSKQRQERIIKNSYKILEEDKKV